MYNLVCLMLLLPLVVTGASRDAAKRAAANEDASRRAAEECLCLLAVLRALLLALGAVEQEVMQQMANDLKVLINKQRYLQVSVEADRVGLSEC
jgi:transcriptional antiterminator Rof (Rho-off)